MGVRTASLNGWVSRVSKHECCILILISGRWGERGDDLRGASHPRRAAG